VQRAEGVLEEFRLSVAGLSHGQTVDRDKTRRRGGYEGKRDSHERQLPEKDGSQPKRVGGYRR
jgi:hypothetical protein